MAQSLFTMNEHKVISLIKSPNTKTNIQDGFDPSTLLLSGACSRIYTLAKSALHHIELLSRSLKASEIKEKKD